VDAVIAELSAGFTDVDDLLRGIVRLLVAMVCGALVGLQREQMGKPAGLRTHMLVATATALFIIAGVNADMNDEQLSRIIQGIVTGIGFLGAGAILKLDREREITGLTTAAGIWMTAAVGVAAGLGRLGTALTSAILAWAILALVGRFESWQQAHGRRRNGE
jgi:putative Mg2+ transporter-C (MgtC) family protein